MNTETQDHIIERRARRVAKAQGYSLVKSRARDPRSYQFGGYMIVDDHLNAVVAGGSPLAYSMTLDDVVDWLEE